MYTMVLLLSMLYSSNGGMTEIQVQNLDYQTCQRSIANWALASGDSSGLKKGYVIEHSDCILQAGETK